MRAHQYKITTKWTGNKGHGTANVSAYKRTHIVISANKPELQLTTDNALYGDKNLHNPEDLLTASVSSCHMMSFLYLCALEGIIVIEYTDNAIGNLMEDPKGGGHFLDINLNPRFVVTEDSMVGSAIELHKKAHEICFIANSLNFPVIINPICLVHK